MKYNLQPFLESDLVCLRGLKRSDFNAVYKVASNPLIWQQHQNKDRYLLENFTVFFNEALASKGTLVIIDTKTQEIIGSSRFKVIDEVAGVIEIGWSFLNKSFWGGTYNYAFKKLMVNYALEKFNWVIFYVNPTNNRSQKAMEKLGAQKMNYLEEPWVLKQNIGITYAISSPLKE